MQTQIYAAKAENAEVWDVEGNRYIDFAAGIAVVNAGHQHPKIVKAIKDQLDRFTHICHQVMPYENYIILAERLNKAVPGDFTQKTLFATTGAEAVENAIIIEPIQGEVGFYITPKSLMIKLRQICDKHSILLIADEVQTGFARTGALFAMEHFDISADITIMAKGLAVGMPLSAVTGRAEIMDSANPCGLGGTYAGNPLTVASANAVLEIIEEENLCARANILSNTLKEKLNQIAKDIPEIVDVHGLGFMIAVEFNSNDKSKPNPDFANRVRIEALKQNLILLTCGIYSNVIRFLAPITISDESFKESLDIIEKSIKAAKG